METKCLKCGYEWHTNSRLVTVSCPSCGNKVKIRDQLKEEVKNEPTTEDKELAQTGSVRSDSDVQEGGDNPPLRFFNSKPEEAGK
jgi:predicted RNA-binding Zn-ribbon protein involved in translation (DUF1610 family)